MRRVRDHVEYRLARVEPGEGEAAGDAHGAHRRYVGHFGLLTTSKQNHRRMVPLLKWPMNYSLALGGTAEDFGVPARAAVRPGGRRQLPLGAPQERPRAARARNALPPRPRRRRGGGRADQQRARTGIGASFIELCLLSE